MLSYWHDADANPAITTSSQITLLATKLLAPTIHFGSPMPTILTLVAPICLVMQILLPSLSLNNFLLFSYILSAPIVHRHTSRYTKISPLTPSSHRTISKIIIFYSRSISCCHTCFAYHTHLTKIITFVWHALVVIVS